MECPKCGYTMYGDLADQWRLKDGRWVLFRNVHGFMCMQCGHEEVLKDDRTAIRQVLSPDHPGHRASQTTHDIYDLLELEVDFRSEQDRGQMEMFGNECSGVCGV